MNDLSFVAGEFPRLASTTRETAEAVRSARPNGGASAFASAMPGTKLASLMQGVEEKFADLCTATGTNLENHADSLEAAERDFIAAEEENGRLIDSILVGHSYGGFPSWGTNGRPSFGASSANAATSGDILGKGRRLTPLDSFHSELGGKAEQ